MSNERKLNLNDLNEKLKEHQGNQQHHELAASRADAFADRLENEETRKQTIQEHREMARMERDKAIGQLAVVNRLKQQIAAMTPPRNRDLPPGAKHISMQGLR